MISLSNLLLDLKIVLILPDRDREIILWGHKLYPRFLTNIEDDFESLKLVIEKMAGHLMVNENCDGGIDYRRC